MLDDGAAAFLSLSKAQVLGREIQSDQQSDECQDQFERGGEIVLAETWSDDQCLAKRSGLLSDIIKRQSFSPLSLA